MSDLWFNLRIWIYHIQAGRREWWRFEVSANDYHKNNRDTPFVQLYELRKPGSWIGGKPASA